MSTTSPLLVTVVVRHGEKIVLLRRRGGVFGLLQRSLAPDADPVAVALAAVREELGVDGEPERFLGCFVGDGERSLAYVVRVRADVRPSAAIAEVREVAPDGIELRVA